MPDKFVGLPEQRQIPDKTDIWLKNNCQFLAPKIAHTDGIWRCGVVVEWANDVDCKFIFPTKQVVVEFPAEGVLIPGGQVLDLAVSQNGVEGKGLEFLADFGRIDIERLDLGLDVFLFVCKELVDLAVALDVGLTFQHGQGFLDLASLPCLISLEL